MRLPLADATVPAREVFRHFPPTLVVAFYLLSALALVVFVYGAWRRLASHATLRKRNPLAGGAHALVFWGFAALFVGTVIIMLDYDMVRLVNPAWRFWRGTFYLGDSVTPGVLGGPFL